MTKSLWGTIQTLRINQSTKFHQSIDADSGFVLDTQPITDLRIQHPLRRCDLRSPGELDNQYYRPAVP